MPLNHRAALLAICLIWAGNFIAAAIAVDHLPAITFTVLRFALVLALLAHDQRHRAGLRRVLLVGLDPIVLAQLDVPGLVLTSAFFLAPGTIFMRRVRGVGVYGFQAWNALLSRVPLILLAMALEEPVAAVRALDRASPALPAVAYSAIGASIIGHGTFYRLIRRHEVNTVTPYLLLVPILAVALGVLLHDDRPGPRLLVGGAMVIAGVLWLTLRARHRGRRVPEPGI